MDYHATTPVDPEVVRAMVPYFTEKFGNASSRQYRLGWDANGAVEHARSEVAGLIGAETKEIVWTSGATEANNLALKGVVEAAAPGRDHVVTVVTEHKSVLDTCKRLEQRGCRTTAIAVAQDGSIDLGRCGTSSPSGPLS
jgi:cysteine desulfurase